MFGLMYLCFASTCMFPSLPLCVCVRLALPLFSINPRLLPQQTPTHNITEKQFLGREPAAQTTDALLARWPPPPLLPPGQWVGAVCRMQCSGKGGKGSISNE